MFIDSVSSGINPIFENKNIQEDNVLTTKVPFEFFNVDAKKEKRIDVIFKKMQTPKVVKMDSRDCLLDKK